MNNKIIFLNDQWLWAILAGAVVLMCVFIWKELFPKNKSRLFLKLALSFFAIIALALIALKPALRDTQTVGKIVILTQGYERSQLDSLKKDQPGLKVSEYDPQKGVQEQIYEAGMVYILGQGLPEYELQKFKNIPAIYIPGPSPAGVVKIRFPNKIAIGEILTISGLYQKPIPGNQLILEGPGGAGIDSVEFRNEREESFKLSAELKAAGKFVYYLTEKDKGGEILSRDPVPVQIEEMPVMKILILNNFPTFETKYLKNFLAEAGHEVVIRSQITRGRYKYEYFNTKRTNIGNLSGEILEPYDLLIIDAPSLRGLSSAQSNAILSAVKENRLGLFIQPDESFFSSPGSQVDLKFERKNPGEIKLEKWPDVNLSVFPFQIKSSPGVELIFKAEGNLGIAGYNRVGVGRIGSTVLSSTWQLVISGKSSTYKELWSHMIGQLAKRETPNASFEPEEQLAFPHVPLEFAIRSQVERPIISLSEKAPLPLVQDINFPEQWNGTIWPREEGWHQMQQDTSSVFNFYISKEGAWRSLKSYKTTKKNLQYFNIPVEENNRHYSFEPINLLWFYGLFLICMGGLWLEPKLY